MPILFHNTFWKSFRNPVYIETGLLQGKSFLQAFRTKLFKKCISIEISKKHINDFVRKYSPIPKTMKLIHGNSKDLGAYISGINEPITFFLDAHDDQRFTKERKQLHDDPEIPCPLLSELEAIANHSLEHQINGHKILIDDMQCFKKNHKNRTHSKHNWFEGIGFNQIISKVKQLFPGYAMYLLDSYRKKDVLVCVPEVTAIPKIIHMTYKNKQLPDLFKECKAAAQQYYRDFELMFHDDKDMETFMEEYFPEFKTNVFDKLPLKIMKIDVFRYCLLEIYGGLYIDMDHQLVRRHSFQKADVFLCLNREKKQGDPRTTIGNSIIASKPDHIFWQYVRETLEKDMPRILKVFNQRRDHITTQRKDRTKFVIESTGPHFLTKVYENHKSDLQGQHVKLISRKVFHTPKPKNPKDLKKFLQNEAQCGFHHCAGTWHKSRH